MRKREHDVCGCVYSGLFPKRKNWKTKLLLKRGQKKKSQSLFLHEYEKLKK